MDPTLYSIDWDVTMDVIGTIGVLAILIERGLALFFGIKPLVIKLSRNGIKEAIAFVVSFLVVRHFDFDAYAIIMNSKTTSVWGYILTALTVAGGTKGAIKLFEDLLGWKTKAQQEKEVLDDVKFEGEKAKAKVKAIEEL